MEITFHGAAQTVTGSQHLLEVNGHRILLDCGLFQGARQESNVRNRLFLYDPSTVDALILSHAHIDHCGNIPSFVKKGYRGPVYCTYATRDLCQYMLCDSGHIQEADADYLNRRALKRGEKNAKPIEPLYTIADAERALRHFDGQPYEKTFKVAPGVSATFYEAGHILGSASVVLDIQEGARSYRLAFSGDIGRLNLPILRDPTLLEEVDYAIMESTYGTKTHRPPEEAYEELRDVVQQTVARGGKIIIPSFAVGRSQELVFELNKLIRSGDIPPIPVYVDSPLAVNASEVFKEHEELYDEDTLRFMRQKHTAPFMFSSLTYVQSVEESKAINDQKGPLVIISASGMCETGRILHHLRNNLGDPRNTLLIVSWQAPNTLGRRLADRAREVRIFGETHKVKAQIATINGYSGHAGRDLLLKWAAALQPRVKELFLVHGEPDSLTALRQGLLEQGLPAVQTPELHQTVKI
jgi:metallo-beta-lactamase family protein